MDPSNSFVVDEDDSIIGGPGMDIENVLRTRARNHFRLIKFSLRNETVLIPDTNRARIRKRLSWTPCDQDSDGDDDPRCARIVVMGGDRDAPDAPARPPRSYTLNAEFGVLERFAVSENTVRRSKLTPSELAVLKNYRLTKSKARQSRGMMDVMMDADSVKTRGAQRDNTVLANRVNFEFRITGILSRESPPFNPKFIHARKQASVLFGGNGSTAEASFMVATRPRGVDIRDCRSACLYTFDAQLQHRIYKTHGDPRVEIADPSKPALSQEERRQQRSLMQYTGHNSSGWCVVYDMTYRLYTERHGRRRHPSSGQLIGALRIEGRPVLLTSDNQDTPLVHLIRRERRAAIREAKASGEKVSRYYPSMTLDMAIDEEYLKYSVCPYILDDDFQKTGVLHFEMDVFMEKTPKDNGYGVVSVTRSIMGMDGLFETRYIDESGSEPDDDTKVGAGARDANDSDSFDDCSDPDERDALLQDESAPSLRSLEAASTPPLLDPSPPIGDYECKERAPAPASRDSVERRLAEARISNPRR